MAETVGFDIHFAVGKINVATSVRTGVSNMPPACCSAMGSNPTKLIEQDPPQGWVLFYGGDGGIRTHVRFAPQTDFESAPL